MSAYNPYSLEGKTILITGASSGIGRATAIECSRMGAKCIITGRNEERLNKTYTQMEGEGHVQVIADLSIQEGIDALLQHAEVLDGLVANAGFTKTAPLPFIKEQDLNDMFQVNAISSIVLLKSLLKKKKINPGASVVYTCSLAGLGRTSLGNSMYAATKGAIRAFVKAAANELSAKKIRVNTVCPAMVETGILNANTITQEQLEADKASYPLKRYARPEEISWGIIYLLSEASAWVTGIDLIMDGGKLLR